MSLLFLAAFVLLTHCRFVHAQAVGTITGTVSDPSGAVIAGARITATRVETGVAQSTVTTGTGTYTIPSLVVGTYDILAEAQGFKSGTATGIALDVAQTRVVDFKLVLAGATTTVEVTAAPPLLNTTDGALAGVVSTEQVQNLPLNGRDVSGLIMMQPGMGQDTGNMGWLRPQWISNGNRAETLVGTLDGGDIADPEMGTLQFTNFNLDAIAEFKVQQNNYSAQYGQGAGTITQIVSKSGTNQFHGSAFDYVRNSAFDARNFFGTSVAPFRRNEFGTTFGGPIKKDKTFFFVQYAGLRQRLGEPNIAFVPTAAERTGIVTVTSTSDPLVPVGQVDQLQVPLNSVAQSVLNRYPPPNQPGGVYGANTFNYEFSQPTNHDQFSARLDHHISSKDTLFARASYLNMLAKEQDPWAAELGGANFSTANASKSRNYTIGETHLVSPTLLNDFSVTLNRNIEGVPEAPAEADTTDTGFADGSLSGWGPDSFLTMYVVSVFDYKDNVAWTKGRHAFNFGAEFRREWDNGTGVTGIGPSGAFNFNSGTPLLEAIPSTNGGVSLPAGSASPSGLISMMEGDDYEYGRSTTAAGYGPVGGGGIVWWGLRRWTLAGYIHDDIKVTRKLTMNMGLRYEYASVPTEVGDRFSEPADYGSLYGTFVVNPQPLWQPDKVAGDFGPRFGLAYDLGNSTVFRGGFGIFTNMIPTVYPDQALVNFPIASLNFLPNATYSLTPQPVTLPTLTSTSGAPLAANGNTKTVPANTPVNFAPYAAILGPLSGDFPSDRMRNGYTINGNATLEHQFKSDIAVSASYVVNNGVSLYNSGYPNAYDGAYSQYTPFTNISPGIGELQAFYNGAHSTYNALQLQAHKTSAAHGIQFGANYTWGKIMTDGDAVWSAPNSSGGISMNNPFCERCEYARASYSIGQRFVANFEYDLPLAHYQSAPKRLTQGWRILGILQAQQGFPFTVVSPYGTLPYGYDGYNGTGARPFLMQQATRNSVLKAGCGPQFFSDAVIGISQDNYCITGASVAEGLGTSYFGTPLVTNSTGSSVLPTPGNLGRNTFTSPSWQNLDFSVIKDTRITESKTLQFRAEFFNLPNQATFGTPGGTLNSGNFGKITGTATAEREIQFGLRFIF
jgi:hypothetical protein